MSWNWEEQSGVPEYASGKKERYPTSDRVILHCDCDSFFASVESVLDPTLRDVPMAVCGSEEDRRGIVLAKNQLAKKYGIQTAETVWSARRKCRDLVTVPPHHAEYAEFSRRINAIYDRYTDQVEPFSIDESFLDVTGSRVLFGDGPAIADAIRTAVREEIGVTVSVGVSFNKIFAKLGSDYNKPDGTTVITQENFRQILYPLPVEAMMHVGRHMSEALRGINICSIGDLAHASRAFLSSRFGRAGELLHDYANGLDDSEVARRTDKRKAKSIGNGMTFRRDLVTEEEIRIGLEALCVEVGSRLREAGQRARGIAVTIKDTMLQTLTRQGPLSRPTDLSRELSEAANDLVHRCWKAGRPIRALTVTAIQLVPVDRSYDPISFFEGDIAEQREKISHIETTLDGIRDRFGAGAITSGAVLGSDFGAEGHRRESQQHRKENANGGEKQKKPKENTGKS